MWFLPLEITLSACIVSTRTDFLNFVPMDIWGRLTLHCGSCLVHCRIFTNIPGLYPLAASSHPVITTQTVSTCCQMYPGSELPLVQYPCSREAAGSAALSNYPTNVADPPIVLLNLCMLDIDSSQFQNPLFLEAALPDVVLPGSESCETVVVGLAARCVQPRLPCDYAEKGPIGQMPRREGECTVSRFRQSFRSAPLLGVSFNYFFWHVYGLSLKRNSCEKEA